MRASMAMKLIWGHWFTTPWAAHIKVPKGKNLVLNENSPYPCLAAAMANKFNLPEFSVRRSSTRSKRESSLIGTEVASEVGLTKGIAHIKAPNISMAAPESSDSLSSDDNSEHETTPKNEVAFSY